MGCVLWWALPEGLTLVAGTLGGMVVWTVRPDELGHFFVSAGWGLSSARGGPMMLAEPRGEMEPLVKQRKGRSYA